MGILKTNSSVYYDWKRGGGRASNTQKVGTKKSSFDLYGKINKQTTPTVLRLVEGGGGLQTPQKLARAEILPLSFMG